MPEFEPLINRPICQTNSLLRNARRLASNFDFKTDSFCHRQARLGAVASELAERIGCHKDEAVRHAEYDDARALGRLINTAYLLDALLASPFENLRQLSTFRTSVEFESKSYVDKRATLDTMYIRFRARLAALRKKSLSVVETYDGKSSREQLRSQRLGATLSAFSGRTSAVGKKAHDLVDTAERDESREISLVRRWNDLAAYSHDLARLLNADFSEPLRRTALTTLALEEPLNGD